MCVLRAGAGGGGAGGGGGGAPARPAPPPPPRGYVNDLPDAVARLSAAVADLGGAPLLEQARALPAAIDEARAVSASRA